MDLKELVPENWRKSLSDDLSKPFFRELSDFLEQEWDEQEIFPPKEMIFRALSLTSLEDVRVLILGQDPYHDDNQAHGLAFSVNPGIGIPPSLRNIYKELEADLGHSPADNGFLESWAKQGVLMINAVLTVRAHLANSHQGRGWEDFTDAVIRQVNKKSDPVVFVLWGAYARAKKTLIDNEKHMVIESPHPSPLSARRGFFGSKPFSKINTFLIENSQDPIDWRIESIQPSLFL